MKFWKVIEAHHTELGNLWFMVPLLLVTGAFAVAVQVVMPLVSG
jgi:hypothetical protein